jgi:hypothetical protein
MLQCSNKRSNETFSDRPYKEGIMKTNSESTSRTEAGTSEATNYTAAYATLVTKGLERLAEAGKTSMDLAVKQNAEVLASCKNVLHASIPGVFVFELAGQAFESYVTLQKSLLDMAVQQSTAVIETSQEYGQDSANTKAEITNLIHQSVDRSVAAQKSVLNFAANQTQAVSDTVKKQPGIAGTPVETVANSVQRGVDTVFSVHKEALDVTAKALKAVGAKA